MMKKLFLILFCVAAAMTIECVAAQLDDNPKTTTEVSATVNVWGGNGVISFSNQVEDMTFVIYSITGQAIKTINVPVGSINIDIPKGFYIVKCNLWSRKVVVK